MRYSVPKSPAPNRRPSNALTMIDKTVVATWARAKNAALCRVDNRRAGRSAVAFCPSGFVPRRAPAPGKSAKGALIVESGCSTTLVPLLGAAQERLRRPRAVERAQEIDDVRPLLLRQA